MTACNKSRRSWAKRLLVYLAGHWELYMFLIPGLVVLTMFKFLPMTKIVIAFKNFKPLKGIEGSKWVGMANFAKMFSDEQVWQVIRNTLEINLLEIAICVPLPMLMAVMLNELNCMPVKKVVQTMVYIPHFFTWVVVYSLFFNMFNSMGTVNRFFQIFTGEPVMFFSDGGWFRFLLVLSAVWKGTGWVTIVYLSAISSIDKEIYEAAVIDGAGKIQQAKYITIPSLLPVLALQLTTRMGSVISGGFDQVLAFYNSSVYDVADVLGTFIYRQGIGQANFSYATAVGLFESAVGLVFVILSNVASKKMTGRSVW